MQLILKEISFGAEPESSLRNFFPSFLARLKADISKPLKTEVSHCYMCYTEVFLARLWGSYAIPLALSVVGRPASNVCRLCTP